jgi:hypothetical protein
MRVWLDEERHPDPAWSGRPRAAKAVVGSEHSPQKHVRGARIVLLSAVAVGTMAIQQHTGKGKPTNAG